MWEDEISSPPLQKKFGAFPPKTFLSTEPPFPELWYIFKRVVIFSVCLFNYSYSVRLGCTGYWVALNGKGTTGIGLARESILKIIFFLIRGGGSVLYGTLWENTKISSYLKDLTYRCTLSKPPPPPLYVQRIIGNRTYSDGVCVFR